MKYLLPTFYTLLGIMFFFLSTSYVLMKDEDKTWADQGTMITGYVLSAVLLIFGISRFVNKEK